MSIKEKKQALENALEYYNLNDYYIYSANGKFALAEIYGTSGVLTLTRFMTYDEFNSWLFGFDFATKLNK